MRAQRAARAILTITAISAAIALLPLDSLAGGNLREDYSLTLTQPAGDTHGFYAAAIDPTNGYAYFASRYVYKIDISGAQPQQIGAGFQISGQSVDAVMDPSAGCAYFAAGQNIMQVLANGTNAATLGGQMTGLFGGYTTWATLLDPSDPANHYLYVMTSSGTDARLYKIALNQFPNASAVLGYASINAGDPTFYHGAIDLSNRCAYFANLSLANPTVIKFSLGSGTNLPARIGTATLDNTPRSMGPVSLDVTGGYGYACTLGDANFGSARIYMFALNGTNVPTLVAHTDLATNEGYCQVSFIRPDRRLLYLGCDLTYPGKVYRLRLGDGSNAPVETGVLPCRNITNLAALPAWGINPPYASNDWGEVFLHSVAYDPIRDYAYFGRDYADGQTQPFHDQIIKFALDRDEMLVSLTKDNTASNNVIPYGDSFESYTNGSSLIGTNGWTEQDSQAAVAVTNAYTNTYAGGLPIPGPHNVSLQIDGTVTNRFAASLFTNIWADMIVQAKFWTDPNLPILSSTPFAFLVTTNGHLAVWNCTNAPTAGNGWTELLDTSVASNQYIRVTIQAAYSRDANAFFHYRVWVNGAPSANPRTWYATADTNLNSFGSFLAQGRFLLDDLVVKTTDPFSTPYVNVANLIHNLDGTVKLTCAGAPGASHRVWISSNAALPFASWTVLSTNVAGVDGSWQVTDGTAGNDASRFYRITLP